MAAPLPSRMCCLLVTRPAGSLRRRTGGSGGLRAGGVPQDPAPGGAGGRQCRWPAPLGARRCAASLPRRCRCAIGRPPRRCRAPAAGYGAAFVRGRSRHSFGGPGCPPSCPGESRFAVPAGSGGLRRGGGAQGRTCGLPVPAPALWGRGIGQLQARRGAWRPAAVRGHRDPVMPGERRGWREWSVAPVAPSSVSAAA